MKKPSFFNVPLCLSLMLVLTSAPNFATAALITDFGLSGPTYNVSDFETTDPLLTNSFGNYRMPGLTNPTSDFANDFMANFSLPTWPPLGA